MKFYLSFPRRGIIWPHFIAKEIKVYRPKKAVNGVSGRMELASEPVPSLLSGTSPVQTTAIGVHFPSYVETRPFRKNKTTTVGTLSCDRSLLS